MQKIYRVMIIDDDPIFNMINKKIMEIAKFGNEIDTYMNPREALLQLKEIMANNVTTFPDVMFIDVNMPGMDGWHFLDELNKFPEFILKKCKIYMLTSSIDDNDIDKSMGYAIVTSLISKPLTMDRLGKMMSQELILPVSTA